MPDDLRTASRPVVASRWTLSSSARSTPSTPVSTCSSPRPPARARPWSPSTRSNGRAPAGGKVFYTTPLKALSNQKYGDLVRVHGAEPGRPPHRRQLGQR